MDILVDYANVEPVAMNRGLDHVVLRILDAIGGDNFSRQERVTVRLYGGWFEGAKLTQLAQTVSAHVQARFPMPLSISGSAGPVPLYVSAELAVGLIADPKGSFVDTYRRRAASTSLVCLPRPWLRCADVNSCGLSKVAESLTTNRCPTTNCEIQPHDIIDRAEQKLVDTLIVVDLLHLSAKRRSSIAIVSNDDDMWPGIKAVLLAGTRLHHVHPRRGARTPAHYASAAGPLYLQTGF